MFKHINSIDDVRPFVDNVKEIRFLRQANGLTIGCYQFMDSHTFETSEALECRGIAFDDDGKVVSRPLHKFFNMGEKAHLSEQNLRARTDIVGIYDKIDGSMIATAWVNDTLLWRSKKSFASDVVGHAEELLKTPKHARIADFAREVAQAGWTAIFELTHPAARIVVDPGEPQLRLLHVRDNTTGAYVLLDPSHPIHGLVDKYTVPQVMKIEQSLDEILEDMPNWKEREGCVLQFANGDMAKMKCPWYVRLHKSVTFLRERDIARAALHEELDDIKNALREIGIDMTAVEEVEARLKFELLALTDEVERIYAASAHLDRKEFALANKHLELFGLAMARYTGRDPEIAKWYEQHKFKDSFGLTVLADPTRADAFDMAGPAPPRPQPKGP